MPGVGGENESVGQAFSSEALKPWDGWLTRGTERRAVWWTYSQTTHSEAPGWEAGIWRETQVLGNCIFSCHCCLFPFRLFLPAGKDGQVSDPESQGQVPAILSLDSQRLHSWITVPTCEPPQGLCPLHAFRCLSLVLATPHWVLWVYLGR